MGRSHDGQAANRSSSRWDGTCRPADAASHRLPLKFHTLKHATLGTLALELNSQSQLSFPLALVDGRTIETVGAATEYFGKLPMEDRERYPWSTVILMVHNAIRAPRFLKTATINLQTALAMDGVLAFPHPLDERSV